MSLRLRKLSRRGYASVSERATRLGAMEAIRSFRRMTDVLPLRIDNRLLF